MENKRVIDITTTELVGLIRMVLKEELKGTPSDIAGPRGERFIDIKEASKLIRYSAPSIYRMVRQNAIPFYRVGRRKIVFKPSELSEWITGKKVVKGLLLK